MRAEGPYFTFTPAERDENNIITVPGRINYNLHDRNPNRIPVALICDRLRTVIQQFRAHHTQDDTLIVYINILFYFLYTRA